jgi:hypothetical protein
MAVVLDFPLELPPVPPLFPPALVLVLDVGDEWARLPLTPGPAPDWPGDWAPGAFVMVCEGFGGRVVKAGGAVMGENVGWNDDAPTS